MNNNFIPFFITLVSCLMISHGLMSQVKNGCIFIDFESIPNTVPRGGLTIKDQFNNEFGLSFRLEDGTFPVLAGVGSPMEAFSSNWGEDQPAPGIDIGNYFITDDGQLLGIYSSPLILEFETPIDSFAGCILDMDFQEQFVIEARDEFGNVLLSETIADGDPNTGDGALTCWGFNLPGCTGSIYSIKFSGTRILSGGFGLGMDNFSFCYSGLNIDLSIRDFSCNTFGQIEIISTTVETYNYSIDGVNYSPNNIIDGLLPGHYEVFVQDDEGCETSVFADIQNIIPIISFAEVLHTSCNESNGQINIFVEPNNQPMFSMNGEELEDNNIFMDLDAGDYLFRILDENGCELDTILTILPSDPAPTIEDVLSIADYCNNGNGQIEVFATGGNGSLSFALNNGVFTSSNVFTGLDQGDYIITVQDELGCMEEVLVTVDPGLDIQVSVRNTISPDCFLANGEIQLNVFGGNGSINYIIDSSDLMIVPEFTNLVSGTYEIILIDEAGCEERINVTVPCSRCAIYFPNVITSNGDGNNDDFQLSTHFSYDPLIKLYNIYDRWGGLAYTKSDFFIHTNEDVWWKGNFNNTDVVVGVFTYLIIIEDPCGEEELFAGDLTVLK